MNKNSQAKNLNSPEAESIAYRFAQVFAGRKDARGTLEGGCVREPLTIEHYINHLNGRQSLGCYSLLDNGTCCWAVVDFDFKSNPNREELAEEESCRYAERLFKLGLKFYFFERSRSGLIHLWMFFCAPVKARKIRKVLKFIARELNLKIANGIVEIFPKQDELSNGQVGNYIHLPYNAALTNGGQLPDRRVMLDPHTFKPIPLELFLDQVTNSFISPEELDEVHDALQNGKFQMEEEGKTALELKREIMIKVVMPYWNEGQRQELSMYLAGFLAKSGASWEFTDKVINEIANKCKDNETPQRTAAIKATFEKAGHAEEIKGYEGLREILSTKDMELINRLFARKKIEVNWPSPLPSEAFHGLAGGIVKKIAPESEADPAALLITFLTAFGNIVGERPFFKVGADNHKMRFFVVLVGRTSKARKGMSVGYIRNIFEFVDPEFTKRIQSGLSSGEGLIWAVRDEIRKKQPIKEKGRIVEYEDVIVDDGIEDKRILVIEDEFASTLRVLGREGNILSAVIRRAWDTGDLQTLTKNSKAKASGAHISIIGHITRGELIKYLTDTEAANGFGNRFLWLCVKRSKVLPFGGDIERLSLEPLIDELKESVEFAEYTGEITWAEETQPLWEQIYPDLSEGKPGLLGAMTARAEAYVTRLACIYALLDKTDEITPEHLKAALAIWDYAESSVKYIFQDATGDTLANEILSALSIHPEGMTRTEINNCFNRHKSSQEINTSLELLDSLGLVRMKSIPTEGRTKEVWILNQ
ncbi:DUF3987 domain-containing protein [Desulfobacterota bacterium AH_259_B03_O07]|nr:DUF3987 domain-containing protein [Desulfobacterota bacterium AH_259_B03_O07]